MSRIKARYTGIYYRFGKNRMLPNGKPDKCFDIHYKAGKKYIWEKVGWVSEGFTIQDAVDLRAQRIRALRHPELATNRNAATIGELWQRYENLCLPEIKAAEYVKSIYTRHIQPYFADIHAENISALDVEMFRERLAKTKKDNGTFISKAYVNAILSLLGRLINKGIAWGLVRPMLSPVKGLKYRNADQKRERFLTKEEAAYLLDALKPGSVLYLIAKTALYTGLRLNEIRCLKREDIDLQERVIYVHGKTGRRYAFIPREFVEFDSYVRTQQHRYLFPSKRTGNPIGISTITKRYREVIKTLGFNKGITDSTQKVVFHTLRHTFCSWLASKGVPILTISELAGHANVTMTRRYAKLSPDAKRDALQQLNTFLASKPTVLEPEIIAPVSPMEDNLAASFRKHLLREKKIPLKLSLDADIAHWYCADPHKINAALRSVMEACQQRCLV